METPLPLETPPGYDLSMAIIEDVSCGKDRTLVKTYGTWRGRFLEVECAGFPRQPGWPCSSWRAPSASTAIPDSNTGLPQSALLTFWVKKFFVVRLCPVEGRMFSSIPGLYHQR